MDLSFFRRAEQRFASRTAAPLDFGLLVAMLADPAAASAGGAGPGFVERRSEASGSAGRIAARRPAWRRAVAAQAAASIPAYRPVQGTAVN